MFKDILRHCIKETKLFFISPLDYIHMRKFISYMNNVARSLGMKNSKDLHSFLPCQLLNPV